MSFSLKVLNCARAVASSNACRASTLTNRILTTLPSRGYGNTSSPHQLTSLSRHFSTTPNPEPNSAEQSLEVIYTGKLTSRIKRVKLFSLSTSLMGISAQPMILQKTSEIGTAMVVLGSGFVGFFTFVTPLLLHLITKKYVIEIAYDKANDEYIATTISIVLTKKQVSSNEWMVFNVRLTRFFP